MFCGACGKELSDSSTVCECGQQIPEKRLAAAATISTSGQTGTLPATGSKSCPYCGEQILPAAIRCKHCQSDLRLAPGQPQGISVQGPPFTGNQPSIVIQNVHTQQGPPVSQPWVYREIKNPGVALFCSLIFPGGGQFYNGEAGKGFFVLLCCWLVIPYIWSLFDAYNSAKRINRTGA